MTSKQVASSRAVAEPQHHSWVFRGNWRPVYEEHDLELSVSGELPAELDGVYLRCGPNPLHPVEGPHHLFDGDGMVHAFDLSGRGVRYRNRFVRTGAYLRSQHAGLGRRTGLMSPPHSGAWPERSPYANTANTSCIQHHGRGLVLSEFGMPHELDLRSLETRGLYPEGGKAAPFSAHARVDRSSGDLWFIRYFVDASSEIEVGRIDPEGRTHEVAKVHTVVPVMAHDFFLSDHYVGVFQVPPLYDVERAAAGRSGWTKRAIAPARILLIGRSDGRCRSVPIEACAVSHVANAFELDGRVVVQAVRFETWPAHLDFDPEEPAPSSGRDNSGKLWEFSIDLARGTVQERCLGHLSIELPRIDERCHGSSNKYVYALLQDLASGIVRCDVQTGATVVHRFGPGSYPGEPLFIPREGSPLGEPEEDGWVLTLVWDSRANRSRLVVLDAAKLDGDPVASVDAGVRIPFGFHGTFVPRCELPGVCS